MHVNALFRSMLKTENIVVEHPQVFSHALDLRQAGMDFVDAMHVCTCPSDQTLVIFDRNLVRRAKRYLPDASVELAV